jgi:hypothetical protein
MNWHAKFTAKHAKDAKKNPIILRGLCALRGSKNNHTEEGNYQRVQREQIG